MEFKIRFILFAFLLSSMSQLHAHDFWLEAQPFYSKFGNNVDIAIFVGEDMFGESLPNISARYTDFSYIVKGKRENVFGEMARYPAGFIQTPEPGVYTIGYRSTENLVNLGGEKFTSYLKEEGLDKIIALRDKNNQSSDSAKEIYSRCVKTIAKVGEGIRVDYSQESFGYTLEITPLKNPYQLKLGEMLPVKVTYLGKPLAKTLIIAFSKQSLWNKQQSRTDENGITKVKLNQSGKWLIKTVEMIPSNREGVDWESFWASLTFELKK